ncbi:MAG: hypothetical protein K2G80_06550, partial [Bacteroidales bacterium]|nr:hypothetical protein [Bacteroidales bacterium]
DHRQTWQHNGRSSAAFQRFPRKLMSSASSNNGQGYDRSIFDTDRFRSNGSGNWVDWEDVSTGNYRSDGFEHPAHDEYGEW